MSRLNPRVLATLAIAVLAITWGSNFLFMKWATEVITPLQVTLLRVFFGFVPVVVYALARRDLKLAHFKYTHHFLVMSVLATSLYLWAFAAGTQRLDSGIAGALSGAVPLFSFLAATMALRDERPTLLQLGGVLLGFAGVVVIARPWDSTGSTDPLGVIFMVLGAASVGLSFVYARKFLVGRGIPATALTTYQIGFGTITLFIVTDLTSITSIIAEPRALIGVIVPLGIIGTGVAYMLYYFIVAQLGAVTASSTSYLPPIVALIIGVTIAGERIDLIDLLAITLIALGLVAIRLFSRTPPAVQK